MSTLYYRTPTLFIPSVLMTSLSSRLICELQTLPAYLSISLHLSNLSKTELLISIPCAFILLESTLRLPFSSLFHPVYQPDLLVQSPHCQVKPSEIAQLCLTLFDPMDCNLQAPPSMGFSRQEDWSGLPFLSPQDLPDPGIEPRSPALQADALPSEPPGKPTLYLFTYPSTAITLVQAPSLPI